MTPASQEQYDDDSYIEVEENKDDKMRRIAKTLQAGDVVEQAHVSIGACRVCMNASLKGRTLCGLSAWMLVVSTRP